MPNDPVLDGYPNVKAGYPGDGYPAYGYPTAALAYPGPGYPQHSGIYSALANSDPNSYVFSAKTVYPGDTVTIVMPSTAGFTGLSYQNNTMGNTAAPNLKNGTVVTGSITETSVSFIVGSRTGVGSIRVFFGGPFVLIPAFNVVPFNSIVSSGTLVFPGQSASFYGYGLDDISRIDTVDTAGSASIQSVFMSGSLIFPGQSARLYGEALSDVQQIDTVTG